SIQLSYGAEATEYKQDGAPLYRDFELPSDIATNGQELSTLVRGVLTRLRNRVPAMDTEHAVKPIQNPEARIVRNHALHRPQTSFELSTQRHSPCVNCTLCSSTQNACPVQLHVRTA